MLNVTLLSLWNMWSMFRNSDRSAEQWVKTLRSKVKRLGRVFAEIKSSLTHLKTNYFPSQWAVSTRRLTLQNIIQEMSAVITVHKTDEG